jgi:Septum formation
MPDDADELTGADVLTLLDGGVCSTPGKGRADRIARVERKCHSCGADPGSGSFCQHCGARLTENGVPTPAAPIPSEPLSVEPGPPEPPAAPPPTVPPVPGGTLAPAPALTPPQIGGAEVSTKRRGCRTGCLAAVVIALVVIAAGGFLGWRYFNDEVMPGIQGVVGEVNTAQETPPGPCYDLETEDGLLTGWNEVSCSGPRQVEVTFAAAFEEGPFPGDEYLTNTAANTCSTAFEDYVGVSPDRSRYDADWLLPTEAMWAGGARQGICLVVAPDGSALTGTIKGSAE